MKKTFIKLLIIYSILFFIINYFNTSYISILAIIRILAISVLCGAALSGITVLLKVNFLKNNKEKLKNHDRKL